MNSYPIKKILSHFFTVSNAIEGIDDSDDAQAQEEFFLENLELPPEKLMYAFHSRMNHLNDYCVAGRIRTYDVFVGGRKCLSPEHIELALTSLFAINPDTPELIKDWHIRFEKTHPFGDGNGRTGRLLLLRQCWDNDVEIPAILRTMDNFEENRQEYYKWF